jgi:glycine betaine/proline transport system permease protein
LNWITDYKIPIGPVAKSTVDWLTSSGEWFFDRLAFALSHVIGALLFILQAPHPLIVLLAITAIAYWLRRSIGVAVFTLLGLLLIMNQGYWKETTETLALVLASTFVSMAIGIPLGIAGARRAWVFSIMRPVLDLMQTIPTFVYLIPALILFGLGMVPGLIATVIFAIPAPIRLTRLGIISTPPSLTQTIMLSLSMVVIAALVGADGLGKPVVRALNTVNVSMGFQAGLCIVILAIILDRMFRTAGEGDGA